MCPVCFTTALLIAGGFVSTGGVAAIAIRKFGVKSSEANDSVPASSERS